MNISFGAALYLKLNPGSLVKKLGNEDPGEPGVHRMKTAEGKHIITCDNVDHAYVVSGPEYDTVYKEIEEYNKEHPQIKSNSDSHKFNIDLTIIKPIVHKYMRDNNIGEPCGLRRKVDLSYLGDRAVPLLNKIVFETPDKINEILDKEKDESSCQCN